MKVTEYAVREDFCRAVRQVRSKLIPYAKEKGTPFKLRFDKLHVEDSIFVYYSSSDHVELTKPTRWLDVRPYDIAAPDTPI